MLVFHKLWTSYTTAYAAFPSGRGGTFRLFA